MARYKSKFESQLGKTPGHYGSHMSHVVVGLIRKRRTKKEEKRDQILKDGKTKPLESDNPFPAEFIPGSM